MLYPEQPRPFVGVAAFVRSCHCPALCVASRAPTHHYPAVPAARCESAIPIATVDEGPLQTAGWTMAVLAAIWPLTCPEGRDSGQCICSCLIGGTCPFTAWNV